MEKEYGPDIGKNRYEKSPLVTTEAINTDHEADGAQKAAPGSKYMTRLPIFALVELGFALLLVTAAAILVGVLNGRVHWPTSIHFNTPLGPHSLSIPSPPALLSIMNNGLTFVIGLSIKDGITIAWWRKATLGGTVNDLDRNYRVGSSPLDAILAGKYINTIAVATLAAAVVGFGEGPLMQRSLTVVPSTVNSTTNITAQVVHRLPGGYTGYIEAHDEYNPNFLSKSFADVINEFLKGSEIYPNITGCSGTCEATIEAAGLAPECTTTEQPLHLSQVGNHVIFDSAFVNHAVQEPKQRASISMHISYAQTSLIKGKYEQCSGSMVTHSCILRPATIEYPVIIQNNAVSSGTLKLDTTASPFYRVAAWTNVTREEFPYGTSTIGGVQLALSNLYNAHFEVNLVNAVDHWTVFDERGSLFNSYINSTAFGGGPEKWFINCNFGFINPVNDILHSINEIMFRTAVSATNSTTGIIQVEAQQVEPVNRYSTDFAYMAGALTVTIVGILLILPTFWGYWELQRKVSLNPIELAEAFNAPVLQKEGGHEDIKELLSTVGERQVKYQNVDVQLGEHTIHRLAIVPPHVDHVEGVKWDGL